MYSYYSNTMFSNSKDNDSSSESDFFDNLTCKDFNFKNLWKKYFIFNFNSNFNLDNYIIFIYIIK